MYNFPWREWSERRVNSPRVEYPLAGVFLGIGKVRRGNGRHCDAGRRTTGDNLLIFHGQTAPDHSSLSFSFDTWHLWTTCTYLPHPVKLCPRLDPLQLQLRSNFFKSLTRLDLYECKCRCYVLWNLSWKSRSMKRTRREAWWKFYGSKS